MDKNSKYLIYALFLVLLAQQVMSYSIHLHTFDAGDTSATSSVMTFNYAGPENYFYVYNTTFRGRSDVGTTSWNVSLYQGATYLESIEVNSSSDDWDRFNLTTNLTTGINYVLRYDRKSGSGNVPVTNRGSGTIDDIYISSSSFSDAQSTTDNGGIRVYAGGYPYTLEFPTFFVRARISDTIDYLENITVELENGTTFTNESSTYVVLPYNDSRLLNFTVSVGNYFNQTYTNYNTSNYLVSIMSPYPQITAYNEWTNNSISSFNVSINDPCYQETANVSTACGGLSTGSYNLTGSWITEPSSNLYDGDYDTYSIAYFGGNSAFNINYSVPEQYLDNPIWQFKSEDNTPTKATNNVTIPDTCWNPAVESGTLRVRVYKQASTNLRFQCHDGSSWNTLYTSGNSADTWVYEEGIYWQGLDYSTTDGVVHFPYNTTVDITISANDYFARSVSHDFTDSNDLNQSIYQSDIKFSAIQLFTNSTVSPADFTINGVTKSDGESFYLSEGSYNVTFSKSGHYNLTKEITIVALENKTINVTDVYNGIVSVTATDLFTGATISSFALNVRQSTYNYDETFSTSTGEINVSVIQGLSYTFNISSGNYINSVNTITPNTLLYNLSVEMYENNTVKLNFFDEITLNPISDVNYAIYTIGGTGYGLETNTSTNSSILIENLPSGLYSIEYSKTNYTTRNYIVNIPLGVDTEANLSLYLLESSESNSFVATVTDTNNRPLEDVYGSLLRRYVIDGQTVYKVVEMFRPSESLSGSAPFTAVPNSVAYLFRVQQDDGTVIYQGSASNNEGYETLYLIDTELFIKVQRSLNAFDIYQDLTGFSYDLTNTSATTFWLSWSDTSSAIEQICLQVKANNTEVVRNSCSTDDSGILSYNAGESNSTYYVARAIVTTTGGSEEFAVSLKTLNYEVIGQQQKALFGFMGIFMLVMTLMVSAIALAREPAIMMIVMALSVIAFSPTMLGLVYLGNIIQGSILVISLILAFIVGKN